MNIINARAPGRAHGRILRGLCLSALLLVAGTASSACLVVTPAKRVDSNIVANYEVAPDRRLGTASGPFSADFEQCTGLIEVDLDVNFPGFTFVRMVEYQGRTYPAYEVSRNSPLFILDYAYNNYGAHRYLPLAVGANSYRTVSSSAIASHLQVVVLSRGGGMLGVAQGDLGTITATPRDSPSLIHTTHVRMGVQLNSPTCMLSDAALDLGEVEARDIAAPGSFAGEMPVQMRMTCSVPDIGLKLKLLDARDPAATGSILLPTAGSTAKGVQVQLLRGGLPVSLGTEWNYGDSTVGDHVVPLSARFIRVPGELEAGTVGGQAVLSVDYF